MGAGPAAATTLTGVAPGYAPGDLPAGVLLQELADAALAVEIA